MRSLIYPILLLLALLCMSCAKTIVVDLQHSSPNTGSIVIAPTSPIIRSAVTLDQELIYKENRAVKEVIINNVPAGEHKLIFRADSWTYKYELNEKVDLSLTEGKTLTHIVAPPPYSGGYYAYLASMGALSLLISLSTLSYTY